MTAVAANSGIPVMCKGPITRNRLKTFATDVKSRGRNISSSSNSLNRLLPLKRTRSSYRSVEPTTSTPTPGMTKLKAAEEAQQPRKVRVLGTSNSDAKSAAASTVRNGFRGNNKVLMNDHSPRHFPRQHFQSGLQRPPSHIRRPVVGTTKPSNTFQRPNFGSSSSYRLRVRVRKNAACDCCSSDGYHEHDPWCTAAAAAAEAAVKGPLMENSVNSLVDSDHPDAALYALAACATTPNPRRNVVDTEILQLLSEIVQTTASSDPAKANAANADAKQAGASVPTILTKIENPSPVPPASGDNRIDKVESASASASGGVTPEISTTSSPLPSPTSGASSENPIRVSADGGTSANIAKEEDSSVAQPSSANSASNGQPPTKAGLSKLCQAPSTQPNPSSGQFCTERLWVEVQANENFDIAISVRCSRQSSLHFSPYMPERMYSRPYAYRARLVVTPKRPYGPHLPILPWLTDDSLLFGFQLVEAESLQNDGLARAITGDVTGNLMPSYSNGSWFQEFRFSIEKGYLSYHLRQQRFRLMFTTNTSSGGIFSAHVSAPFVLLAKRKEPLHQYDTAARIATHQEKIRVAGEAFGLTPVEAMQAHTCVTSMQRMMSALSAAQRSFVRSQLFGIPSVLEHPTTPAAPASAAAPTTSNNNNQNSNNITNNTLVNNYFAPLPSPPLPTPTAAPTQPQPPPSQPAMPQYHHQQLPQQHPHFIPFQMMPPGVSSSGTSASSLTASVMAAAAASAAQAYDPNQTGYNPNSTATNTTFSHIPTSMASAMPMFVGPHHHPQHHPHHHPSNFHQFSNHPFASTSSSSSVLPPLSFFTANPLM